MRISVVRVALAALIFGAKAASAFFEIDMQVRPGTDNSDLVSFPKTRRI